jgi:very-short-patch-repair endonuclease
MGRKVARADMSIAEIAERQHGVVSVRQLYGLGLGERAVRVRVDAGRLHRVHRGVYAVGHAALSLEGRWLAAVLAIGGGPSESGGAVLDHWGAAVSHRSAACLWKLLPMAPDSAEVIVSGSGGRARRPGIRVHRSTSLASGDITLCRGVPVTSPARTIADLHKATMAGRAGAVSPRRLRKAIRQANVLGMPIDEEDRTDRTRGDLERAFLRICRWGRFSAPEVNVRIGPYLVDFFWREPRLVVETDSYLHHRGLVAFQDDRGRDLELRRRGYEVIRLSERQINEERDRVAEVLGGALRAGGDI